LKIGIIAPIRFLESYCTTGIQYCLPRLLVQEASYRSFYKGRQEKGDIVILDCRQPTWKRLPENFHVVEEALRYIEPDLVILPSYMFNRKRTIGVVKDWRPQLDSYSLGAVLEGTNLKEVSRCTNDFSSFCHVIPSHIYNIYLPNIGKLETSSPTIYLENHSSPFELGGLGGILLTSLPIRLGLQGRLLHDYLPSPPSLNFYEAENSYPKVVEKNIEEVLEFYGSKM
jgi:hypothetical protein